MPLKKSQLYSSLWAMCDELRGGMDASQYKDYVLVLLFMKYVSDKYAGQKNALLDVPKGGSFADMVALKGDKNIGDKINKIIAKLAEANELRGVIDVADFNDPNKLGTGKEMVDRLSNLVAIFDSPDLDFRANRADGDDLLGDAYEYLMRHFATESGKSKGQFYTPAEVSRVMAKIVGAGGAKSSNQTIYDPTCGSGSLLLKAHDEAKSATGLDLAMYGQENDNATAALAKMNMILHDCPAAAPDIWKGNTLAAPYHKEKNGSLKRFDFVVANPPFSTKAWMTGFNPAEDEFHRFPYGLPPAKNGDFAFLLHILASLKSTGKGVCVLPHGVLFRGGAEAAIRRELVRQGFVKAIIGLPTNLFYGTSIPACLVVVDKENAAARTGIFMIDASRGFIKDDNKNRLRAQDIHKIVDVYTRQTEILRYSRLVPLAEIADPRNDFNLNLPRYIDAAEPEDAQDIKGHLRGGIPERDIDALAPYWQVLPAIRTALFKKSPHAGYLDLVSADVKAAIFGHPEFTAFKATVNKLFAKWKVGNTIHMKNFTQRGRPKGLVTTLSEDLLAVFTKAPLLDSYDIYQHLMDYWIETMQDDCYLIAAEGWGKAAKPKAIVEDKKSKEKADLTVGKKKYDTALIPSILIIARYFAPERASIEELEVNIAALQQQIEEIVQEHGGENGLLEDAKNDKDKLTKASVTSRLKDIQHEADASDERKVLIEYLALIEREATASTALKTAQESLMKKALEKYAKLTEDEIKALVVNDKWLVAISGAVSGELDRVSQTLADRVSQLADRYAKPLPKLTSEVASLALRVDDCLRKMGVEWK